MRQPLAYVLPYEDSVIEKIHRFLYLLGLLTIACGLGWSKALMSIGQFIIAGNWLLETKFIQKWEILKQRKILWLMISIFWLGVIGFLWTENFDYALKDSRIKSPLFIIPFVIGTSKALSKKEWQWLTGVYLSSLFILSIASLFKLLGWFGGESISDKRELSIFISHIRYGLNLLMGVLLSIHLATKLRGKLRLLLWTLAGWLAFALLMLQLYTAFGIGLGLLALYALFQIKKLEKSWLKLGFISVLIIPAIIALFIINGVYRDFNRKVETDYSQNELAQYSENNNEYFHEPSNSRTENGVFIYRYIQKEEIEKEWNQRSEIEFDGQDRKGNELYQTLIRFLSSKGLKKDSSGIAKLSDDEINAIENGIANQYYLNHWPLQNRIFSTFYEIKNYQQYGHAEGYSLGMRLEYWKTAWRIIRKHPLIGVGTGDVQDAFDLQYHLDESGLSEQRRRRAHNQYLTYWLSFGPIGLIWLMFYLFYPLSKSRDQLFWAFIFIAAASFLTEDTLETQAGVTFFAFFYILLFSTTPNQIEASTS